MIKQSSRGAAFVSGAGILLMLVFLGVFACLVARDPLYYFYDDALFYLQIARSVVEGRGPEFAQGIDTNGFHPFWLLVCSLVAAFTDDKWSQLVATAWLIVAVNAAWMLAALLLFRRHFPLAFVTAGVLLGAGYVFFFSYGMESGLALLMYLAMLGAAARHEGDRSGGDFLLAALFAGLAVFARLDVALMVAPVALWLAFSHWQRHGAALSYFLPAGLLGIAAPAAWLLFNKLHFGAFTPISGMLKMSSAEGGALPAASGVVYLFLTTVAAASALALTGKLRTLRGLVLAAGLGPFLFLGYLVAAGNNETYAWYFAVLAGSMGFFLPAALEGGRKLLEVRLSARTASRLALLAAGLSMPISAILYYRNSQRPMGLAQSDHAGRLALGNQARALSITNVLAFDRPGVLAYLDGLNVIAADGLTSNLALQEQLRTRGLPWLLRDQRITGIVVPRLYTRYDESICGARFLGSSMLVCERQPDGKLAGVEMRYFSRLDGREIGRIPLRGLQKIDPSPERDFDFYILPRGEWPSA